MQRGSRNRDIARRNREPRTAAKRRRTQHAECKTRLETRTRSKTATTRIIMYINRARQGQSYQRPIERHAREAERQDRTRPDPISSDGDWTQGATRTKSAHTHDRTSISPFEGDSRDWRDYVNTTDQVSISGHEKVKSATRQDAVCGRSSGCRDAQVSCNANQKVESTSEEELAV